MAAPSSDRARPAESESRVFTLAGYRALLQAFLDRGYRVRTFDEAEPAERHLILRHDLDMSLEAALPVAEVEAQLGLSAVFFVLLRSEFYNPHTPRARGIIDRLRSLGHDVGLHFDASLYDQHDLDDLDRAAAAECAALERAMDAPVRMISFHRPAPALIGLDRLLAGRDHAYRPRYISDMGYCADSRGAWHHGHPLDHLAVAEGRALQLLTHPIWWTGTAEEGPVEKLERFLAERRTLLQQELAANCEPYRWHVGSTVDGDRTAVTSCRPPMRILTLNAQQVRDCLSDFLEIGADVDGEYWQAEHFLLDLPEKWVLSFAVWSVGQPVAYAVLSRRARHHVHLHHLMVSAPFRNFGVGSLMASEMVARAERVGARVLTLKVAKTNDRACQFYRNLGFSVVGSDGVYALLSKELGQGTSPGLQSLAGSQAPPPSAVP